MISSFFSESLLFYYASYSLTEALAQEFARECDYSLNIFTYSPNKSAHCDSASRINGAFTASRKDFIKFLQIIKSRFSLEGKDRDHASTMIYCILGSFFRFFFFFFLGRGGEGGLELVAKLTGFASNSLEACITCTHTYIHNVSCNKKKSYFYFSVSFLLLLFSLFFRSCFSPHTLPLLLS